MEADVITRKIAAATNAQRLELERMHRFIQVAAFATSPVAESFAATC
jgi:hypothetical protein